MTSRALERSKWQLCDDMQGQIGKLSQNDHQIGGFLDWKIFLQLESQLGSTPWKEQKIKIWKATASRFWLLLQPGEEEIRADFYIFTAGKLVLANTALVAITFPSKKIGEYIHEELTMFKRGE